MTLVGICIDIEVKEKLVKRFVTKARFRKFETQTRNLLIEMSFLRKRIADLEQAVFKEVSD